MSVQGYRVPPKHFPYDSGWFTFGPNPMWSYVQLSLDGAFNMCLKIFEKYGWKMDSSFPEIWSETIGSVIC